MLLPPVYVPFSENTVAAMAWHPPRSTFRLLPLLLLAGIRAAPPGSATSTDHRHNGMLQVICASTPAVSAVGGVPKRAADAGRGGASTSCAQLVGYVTCSKHGAVACLINDTLARDTTVLPSS